MSKIPDEITKKKKKSASSGKRNSKSFDPEKKHKGNLKSFVIPEVWYINEVKYKITSFSEVHLQQYKQSLGWGYNLFMLL